MTNGDKLQQMFPDAEVCHISRNYFNRHNRVTGLRFKGETETVWFPISWWNAKYKESKEVDIYEEHSCVTCKFGNLYSDSEPCCNCTDDNDMFEPIESEVENGNSN